MIQITLSGDAQRALEQMPEQLTWALERAISRTAQEGAVFMKQELARQRLAATSTHQQRRRRGRGATDLAVRAACRARLVCLSGPPSRRTDAATGCDP